MTTAGLVTMGVGLATAVGSLALFSRCPTRRFFALLWLAIGLCVALVGWKPHLFELGGSGPYTARIRMATGLLSFLVLMITLEAVRRTAMEERYALLWVFTGLILLVVAIYPDAVGWLVSVTGMHYVSAIVMVVFGFLVLVAFDFSLALSQQREKHRALTQSVALLERRVAELEDDRTQATPGGSGAEGAASASGGKRQPS